MTEQKFIEFTLPQLEKLMGEPLLEGNLLVLRDEYFTILNRLKIDPRRELIISEDGVGRTADQALEDLRKEVPAQRLDLDEALCTFLYWLENESGVVEEFDELEECVEKWVEKILKGQKNPLLDVWVRRAISSQLD